jgi:MoxR-like ATPase
MVTKRIRIQCPECHRVMGATADLIGKLGGCPCGAKFRITEELLREDPTREARPRGGGTRRRAAPKAESPADFPKDTDEAVSELAAARERLLGEVGKIIVGQGDVIDQIMTAFFARGHCVLEGVPGLAKTLMISCLADSMALAFKRVQFTPDLMPTDITGTTIIEEDENGRRQFVFTPGPVFTNILLADEINRTPPKTQAALLEAMQERQVTVSGETYDLPKPFLVLATQNPLEQEGTYPLPEAQLDRFLFLVKIDYPSEEEEDKILLSTTLESLPELEQVLDADAIIGYQNLVRRVPVSPYVANYATRIARATRPGCPDAPDFIRKWVRWGCGPRAGQALLLAAKARVVLHGGFNVSCEDVRTFVHPALRHRIGLNFAAVSEGCDADDIIDRLVEAVPEEKPRG